MDIDIGDLITVDIAPRPAPEGCGQWTGAAFLKVPGHTGDARTAIRYVRDAHPAEPLFVIRGRDALAFPALLRYAKQCDDFGLERMADQVYDHATRFMVWQAGYAPLTKLPDPSPKQTVPFSAPQASGGASGEASPFSTMRDVKPSDSEIAAAVEWAQQHGWCPTDGPND